MLRITSKVDSIVNILLNNEGTQLKSCLKKVSLPNSSISSVPNLISLLRILILPFMLYFMYQRTQEGLKIAFGLFVIGSVSDVLDGYLARSLKSETKFGAMLDQISDKIFVISTFLMMAILKWMKNVDLIPVFLILFRDFAISGLRQFYKMRVDIFGKFKTVFQIITLFLIFLSVFSGGLYGLERVFLWVSCLLGLLSFLNYLRYM
ncbi:MAG: CDP-alcohol phosphatidyltransferase family protein [Alphaproteobacteria bacterium]|nr:MAG: CDP-alcohol phosphatidyltransferase family protein [Alphaproteobacteria bacterium]